MGLNPKMTKVLAAVMGITAGFVAYAVMTSQKTSNNVAAEVVDQDGTDKGTRLSSQYDAHIMDVQNPLLSPAGWQGRALYKEWCSSCHGKTTGGTAKGPPLVMYAIEHHGDDTFHSAVRSGVKQHHWPFGDMPAVPGLTREEISKIILYVRETQIADKRRHGELNE